MSNPPHLPPTSYPFNGNTDENVLFANNASINNSASSLVPLANYSAQKIQPFQFVPVPCTLDYCTRYDINVGDGVMPFDASGNCVIANSYTYRVYKCGSPSTPIQVFTTSDPNCAAFSDPKPVLSGCDAIYVTVELNANNTTIGGDPSITIYAKPL